MLLPDTNFYFLNKENDEIEPKTSSSIFKNTKNLIIGVPTVFDNNITDKQILEIEENYEKLKEEKPIDEIYVVSVNDPFIMNAWKKHLNIKKIKVLSDGNGDFCRELKLLYKMYNCGMGEKCWRFAMYTDGVTMCSLNVEHDTMDFPPIINNYEHTTLDSIKQLMKDKK